MKSKYLGMLLVMTAMSFTGYTAYSSHQETKLLEVSLANLEALAGEDYGDDEADSKEYNWSALHDCDGVGTGDYNVCEKRGPGNSCSTPGDKTCDCGRNCD